MNSKLLLPLWIKLVSGVVVRTDSSSLRQKPLVWTTWIWSSVVLTNWKKMGLKWLSISRRCDCGLCGQQLIGSPSLLTLEESLRHWHVGFSSAYQWAHHHHDWFTPSCMSLKSSSNWHQVGSWVSPRLCALLHVLIITCPLPEGNEVRLSCFSTRHVNFHVVSCC